MSASASNTNSETTPSAPMFSYAQAAKGRSPSLSAAVQNSKPNSEFPVPTPRSASAQQSIEVPGPNGSIATRRASEGQLMKEKADGPGPQNDISLQPNTKPTVDGSASAADLTPEVQPQIATSSPSSPGFGISSASTMPKEDDAFATPNGSSESTWDKVSQTSQIVERSSSKAEGDEEDSKISSWEHVPVSAQLKEAPPPAFNFWQKRAMEAKATKDPQPSLNPTTPLSKEGTLQATTKFHDSAPELGRLDSKKRTKSGQMTEDKYTSPTVKESVKAAESRQRHAEEDKKNVGGNRSIETSRPAVASNPPPPPGDAISWPTPDVAKEGEKKKSLERNEKGEKERTPASKPHGKEKWVPVPYVPSAVFNTPLPLNRRGGRGGRGGGREPNGRGGHTAHGSIGGASNTEKSSAATTGNPATPAATSTERSRGDMGPPPPRSGSLTSRPKRAVSAGPSSSRDQQRRVTDPALQGKDELSSVERKQSQESCQTPIEARRASTATQTDTIHNGHQTISEGPRRESYGSRRPSQNTHDRDNSVQGASQDHAHPRSTPDRRHEGSMRQPESFREYNGFSHGRERGEGRPERGRGGFRSRGGYSTFGGGHSVNSQNAPPTHAAQQNGSGYSQPKSQSYTERNTTQAQNATFIAPPRETRGHRANARSQSISNSTSYGRYTNGGPPPGTQHLPALQTDVANIYGYQPGHPAVMSAMTYPTFVEQVQLINMVTLQMEYYFSLDNLLRDMFLRKHMDSQGFVFLTVLMNFNRIKLLTTDVELVRYVCRMSTEMEFQTGLDGIDRVRKAEGWQQWILSMEERDPTARNEVPVPMQQVQLPPSMSWDPYRASNGMSTLSPLATFPIVPNRMGISTSQTTNGVTLINASTLPDGVANDYSNTGLVTHTPLSAAVPDFTPHLQSLSDNSLPTLEPHTTTKNTFSDEQVESLMIVIRKPQNSTTPVRVPFSSAPSRTFSNGSIDSATISDEISGSKDHVLDSDINGTGTPESDTKEGSHRSRSPFNLPLPSKPSTVSASPVFWVKDREAPIGDLPRDLTHESYTFFRQNALKQREQSLKGQCHRDMDILYQFWSHFLIRNFNARMYEEFRHLAFEDSVYRDTAVGLRNLVMYYDESILGQKTISDDLARDYVELVKTEISRNEKLAFDKLRAAWRNGALNLKNRVKIDKILDTELKAELER